jgi:hypothetical protein
MGRDGIALGWIFFGEEVAHGSDKAVGDVGRNFRELADHHALVPILAARSLAGLPRDLFEARAR